VGTVPVGVETLQIVATVVSPGAETNTASISHSDQFDPDPGNNSASSTVTPQQADLALAKTVNDPTPNVGNNVTFTVTLSNLGPDPATNVTVGDALPSGLTLVSATPSEGTYTGGVWTVGTVTPSMAQTLTITATVVSPNAETNTATISHSDQFDPDPGNNRASATVTPQQADLAVSKTVSNPTPNVNDTITYTITVTNNGPDTATNVTVHDTLPVQVSARSSTASQGSYDPATGIWTVGTVPVGVTETLTITALVVSANPQANTASISHSDQFDPNPNNNSDTTGITPQQSDLEMAKSVSDPRPNVGDNVTFTVTLRNNGPSTATGVTVTDVLPTGLTFVSDTPSLGTYNPATGIWSVGTVPVGVETLQIVATVVSPGAETNTATASGDQSDPDPGNNSASSTVTPQQADLALTKTVNDLTPNVGDTITFMVTLANLGPDTATGVTVTEPLPSGLTFVSATPSLGTYNSATGVWTVGTVTTSVAQTLTITALVISPSPETNTATISHSDQFDPDTSNNSASATETPRLADLALRKTVNDPTPNVGDTVAFTITLSNLGPDPATNVTVGDALPSGLTLLSATPSAGTYNSTTGLWTVGTVATSVAPTLTLTARVVSPAPETNTARITHSDQFDPDSSNNSAGATVTPQQADLALTKTVSNPNPNVGDTITYTVTLTNNGPARATNVTVSDMLPAGLTLVSAVPSQGTYNAATGLWTVGTVPPTIPVTLTLSVIMSDPGPETNTATVAHSDQFDPDPANNTASVTVSQLALSSLAGSVFFDTNNNGIRDPGEMGIPGVTVTLTTSDPVFATVVTDATGNYLFRGLFPGTYTLTMTEPPNMLIGVARVGTLGGVTVGTSIVDIISVGPNQAGTNYEFGLLGLSDPSKFWLLSNADLSQLFGPPGSGVTDVNPVPSSSPIVAAGASAPTPSLLVVQSASDPLVEVYAPGATTPQLTFDPFPGYVGRLAVAVADVTGNGTPDVIVATAQGSSHVAVFDAQTGALLQSFMAFPGFGGGLTLTTGDVTGSGYADIIVGTATGSSHVKVFDGRTGALVQSFLAFPGYDGGVQVSAGDATGTGRADIAVAPLSGSSHVEVFDGQSGALLQSFMAFPGFTGNISLAYVPVNGVLSVLYVGTATGGSEVKAFGPDDSLLQDFVAYPGFGGGVQLAAGDPTGTGPSALLTLAVGTDHEKVFSAGGAEIDSFFAASAPGVDLTDSLLWFARQQNV
jgi:uncharacterized repeat protein (TIGR01451 family)